MSGFLHDGCDLCLRLCRLLKPQVPALLSLPPPTQTVQPGPERGDADQEQQSDQPYQLLPLLRDQRRHGESHQVRTLNTLPQVIPDIR